MEQNQEQYPACRSIFKDGQFVTNTEAYTRAWITFINQTERNKSSDFGTKMTKNLSCDILLLEQLVPILKEIWT